MKMQYNDFQQKLQDNLYNKEILQQIIRKNKDLINETIRTMGSGNPILTKPYDTLYDAGKYDFASFYQTEIENINEIALFGEDG